ncbi:MAG: replicative DNA helicase [Anaerolineales bacterium]
MSDEQLENSNGGVAPHSQDAEEAVLGSILINPGSYYEVAAFLTTDDFFILRNAWVWEAMSRLYERNEIIEYLTVVEELRAIKRLEDVGGSSYVAYLASNIAVSLHAEAYGRIVERTAIRRRMLEAAFDITKLAREEESDIKEVIDQAESRIFGITERQLKRDVVPINEAMSEYFDLISFLYQHQEEPVGVPSGFIDLDKILGGFQKSDLIILAARPGMGKTSFKLNVAMNAARTRARVAIFSLEMSREQLMQRLVSTETGIDSQALRLGRLDQREYALFLESTYALGDLPIYMDDTPALSVLQLRTKCRRLYREHGLDLIIVDYLQLMTSGQSLTRNENRVQEISYISRGLKELARELKVPVLAGAQLSRAVEQRMDKRPLLSDLRESGSIEQDADVVMFIYRDDVYNEASERPNQADIIVAKHRNGPTGVAPLWFRKQLTQFANITKSNTINLEDI